MPGCGGEKESDMSTYVLEIKIVDPLQQRLAVPTRIKHFTEHEAHECARAPFDHAIEEGYIVDVVTLKCIAPDPSNSRYAHV